MSDAELATRVPQTVELVVTVSGLRAHLRVEGEVLCHARQPSRTFEDADGVPNGGLCNHCERLAAIQNLEVPTND